jgi:beta-galactosidase
MKTRKMQSHKAFLVGIVLVIAALCASAQDFKPGKWQTVGRGMVELKQESAELKECFIVKPDTLPENYLMTFDARVSDNAEEVQIWSGFGFRDRDNRYALGLRGGNNNDLYLCRYESSGKDKLLALESLGFSIAPGTYYRFKIVFMNGDIRVYLNGEKTPTIAVKDDSPMSGGFPLLGGGWIAASFKGFSWKVLTGEEIRTYARDTVRQTTTLTTLQKEVRRKTERSKYAPLQIGDSDEARTEISLDGTWLFKPDYEIARDIQPMSADSKDMDWHLMEVPQFWNPARSWLYLQDSGLPHAGSGVSDNYRKREEKRCAAYTFDYRKTESAWYRQWIELPQDVVRKRISLHFDAVSKIADVYVNGTYVGGNVGMFGYFDCDISSQVKPGRNLVAVHVKVRTSAKDQYADMQVARAVSMDITNDMLNSLPHGMFSGTEGGIWQPVKLVITNPVHISDIFAQVRTDGADIHVTCTNSTGQPVRRTVTLSLNKLGTDALLYRSSRGMGVEIPANDSATITYPVSGLSPELWTPETPNLYRLRVDLMNGEKREDGQRLNIGFRTFETRGNRFYLNGIQYWLRGANHPPCGIAPNDSMLANTFLKLMHDGNQMVTRSHACPFTQTWMDAADRQGVAVSYEGTWPWFLIKDLPAKELVDVWKSEFLKLVRRYRNHPSLFVWTINNEMYFTMFSHDIPKEQRLKQWTIISDAIKEIRQLHPGIPINCDSGYDRVQEDYDQLLKPNQIDDGDTDDRHVYFNWYNEDFFQIYDGEFGKRIYWTPGANPDRPYFGQEVSTGYPNNDDGHFCRKYIFHHYVPHAFYGDWAWEDHDPALALRRHAMMTKELAEVIRRTSPETSGLLLFANTCWYRNVYDPGTISPYPVHAALKMAYQPVLPSLELFGRNFYAGSTFQPRFYVVNDGVDGKALAGARLEWRVVHEKAVLASGGMDLPLIPHGNKYLDSLHIAFPSEFPGERAHCTLVVNVVQNENTIARNEYDVTVAKRGWLSMPEIPVKKRIGLFDLTGKTRALFDSLGIRYILLRDLTQIRTAGMDALVVANLDAGSEVPYNWEDVKNMPAHGIPVLLLHAGKHLQWLFPGLVDEVYDHEGRLVQMKTPEHPAFKEIEPLDIAWWQQEGRERPTACRRSYRLKETPVVSALCEYLRPHVYISNPGEELKKMSGVPLVEIREGGILVASELELNMGVKDPVAAKLFVNLLEYLLTARK